MRVRVSCPAKVNLHLEVLGLREDGYHELRTVFAAVGLWDELALSEVADGLTLTVEPPEAVSAGPENLVLRAARALATRLPRPRGAHIVLHKRIPVAAGLGGGSSDAAATLVGLRSLWDLDVDDEGLQSLAASLGADVPYFLLGGAAWGTGRGDALRALPDLAGLWVLILPGRESVSTAEVYRRLGRLGPNRPSAAEVSGWVENGGALPASAFRNDLEPTVLAGWPEVGERLAALRSTGPAVAMVSGSGGSVFGLFTDEAWARRAAATLSGRPSVVAPILARERSRLCPSSEGE